MEKVNFALTVEHLFSCASNVREIMKDTFHAHDIFAPPSQHLYYLTTIAYFARNKKRENKMRAKKVQCHISLP